MSFHFRTKRVEFEIASYGIYLSLAAFRRTFVAFRDFSGQGLSTTDWNRVDKSESYGQA
ncbi:hypothetical protein ACXHXG_01580 [Rhizobium sp. LEGMi198b]